MSTLEERFEKEEDFIVAHGTVVDANVEQLLAFIQSEIEQAKLEEREDIIKWITDPKNSRVAPAEAWIPNIIVVDRDALLSHLQSPVAPETPKEDTR